MIFDTFNQTLVRRRWVPPPRSGPSRRQTAAATFSAWSATICNPWLTEDPDTHAQQGRSSIQKEGTYVCLALRSILLTLVVTMLHILKLLLSHSALKGGVFFLEICCLLSAVEGGWFEQARCRV